MTERKRPRRLTKKERQDRCSSAALRPCTYATTIVQEYGNAIFGEDNLEFVSLNKAVHQSTEAVTNGDMKPVEAMLYGQAVALQMMFTKLARQANQQSSRDNIEALMKLAFRAQNQCRMTLETLSNVKNPPVVYARQANIANGPQQVNNGITHATEKNTVKNELLEDDHVKRLDGRTTGQAIGHDTHVETVAVCRGENA